MCIVHTYNTETVRIVQTKKHYKQARSLFVTFINPKSTFSQPQLRSTVVFCFQHANDTNFVRTHISVYLHLIYRAISILKNRFIKSIKAPVKNVEVTNFRYFIIIHTIIFSY